MIQRTVLPTWWLNNMFQRFSMGCWHYHDHNAMVRKTTFKNFSNSTILSYLFRSLQTWHFGMNTYMWYPSTIIKDDQNMCVIILAKQLTHHDITVIIDLPAPGKQPLQGIESSGAVWDLKFDGTKPTICSHTVDGRNLASLRMYKNLIDNFIKQIAKSYELASWISAISTMSFLLLFFGGGGCVSTLPS